MKVCTHASRVMDEQELKGLKNLHNEFYKAVHGQNAVVPTPVLGSKSGSGVSTESVVVPNSGGKVIIPQGPMRKQSILGNKLANILQKRKTMRMSVVKEENEDGG